MIVIIILISLYLCLLLYLLVGTIIDKKRNPDKYLPEQFEGKDRYEFLREGWYGEVEYYDRKEKKIKVD